MCQSNSKIENFLWHCGLTPNYAGFSCVALALDMARQGMPISQEMLNYIAAQTGRTRKSVYAVMNTALEKIPCIPRDLKGIRYDRLYLMLHFLYERLQNELCI